MNKRFYTYALLDPRYIWLHEYGNVIFPARPFYIGKGCNNRHSDHLKNYRLKNGTYKSNIINKILSCGLKPFIHVIFNGLSEKSAFRREIFLIQIIGRHDLGTGCLTNKTSGGDGVSGNIVSEETRKKLSIAHIGLKQTPEAKLKQIIAQTGKCGSERQKMIVAENNAKRIWSAESKKKISDKKSIPIYQFDRNGNFIKEWRGISDARKVWGNGLSHGLGNNYSTYKNFIWEYKENCYAGY